MSEPGKPDKPCVVVRRELRLPEREQRVSALEPDAAVALLRAQLAAAVEAADAVGGSVPPSLLTISAMTRSDGQGPARVSRQIRAVGAGLAGALG